MGPLIPIAAALGAGWLLYEKWWKPKHPHTPAGPPSGPGKTPAGPPSGPGKTDTPAGPPSGPGKTAVKGDIGLQLADMIRLDYASNRQNYDRRLVAAFQRDQGLPVNGVLDQVTLSRLAVYQN